MTAAAARAPMGRPHRAPSHSPRRDPRISTRNDRPGLRVVMASRRRRMMRRARIGLIAVAMALFGIIFVGVAQLRLTTQTAEVERTRAAVQAEVSDYRTRLSEQGQGVTGRASSELGMVSAASSGEKALLP